MQRFQIPRLQNQWRRLRNKLKRDKHQIVPLPVELYLLIFEQLERKDLYGLLLVCRDFYFPAEKVLYRNIQLTYQKVPSHLQLFQSIISSERTAYHVHSLTIAYPPAPFITGETYWNLLTQALCATRNLEGFYWLAPLAPEVTWPYSTIRLFSGCTFQLRTLVFHASYSAHIALDTAFLDLQTELVELDFPRMPFPPHVFPKLTTLIISCRETARLIDRPSLRAVCSLEPTLFLNAPWPTSNIITSLRLRLPYIEDFSRIIHACPRLRFLRIDNIVISYFVPLSSWDQSLKCLFAQIDHLTSLEKLSLQFPFKPIPDDIVHEAAFNQLRSLQAITVEGRLADACVRWVRDNEVREIVERNEDEWRNNCWH